jgi:DNA-directed RNA polymerase specialized sigma24 family protein
MIDPSLSGHAPRNRTPQGESNTLLEEVAEGSQMALGRLYTHWAPTLHSVAMRVLRSSECAEEIVDDVFVYVWQHAGAYDPERGTVGAWLSVATRYRAIDRVRRDRKHSLLQNGAFIPRYPNAPDCRWERSSPASGARCAYCGRR